MCVIRRAGLCLALMAVWLLGTRAAWARKWTDSTGRFSLEAELVEVKAGKVRLRQANGRVLDVPLARLSVADRKYLQSIEQLPDKPPKRPQPPVAWKVDAAAIGTELAKPTSFQFTATPLHEALEVISRQHGINIFLSIRDLNDVGLTADQPVTGTAQRARLDESLSGLLKPLNLTWLVQDDVVLVTTEEEAEQRLETRVYRPLGPANVDRLVAEMTANVAPTTWDRVGGPGSIVFLLPGAMVISQTAAVHGQIEQRYAKMLRPVRPPARQRARPPRHGRPTPQLVLAQPADFTLLNTPLDDVVKSLADKHKVNLRLDQKALADVGLGADTPVTLQLHGVRLESGLRLLLGQIDLTFMTDKDGILITTMEEAEQDLRQVSYPVRDLVPRGNFDELIDVITSTVAPTTWAEVGGPGNIRANAPRGSLEVQQTQQIHQELARLLTLLRQAPR